MRLFVCFLVLIFFVSGCALTDPRKKKDKPAGKAASYTAEPAEEIVAEEDIVYAAPPAAPRKKPAKKAAIKGETVKGELIEESDVISVTPVQVKGETVEAVEENVTVQEEEWVK